MKVHPVIHFFGKNTIRLVLVLVFVGIPAAAYYLRNEGVGFGAKEALGQALSSEAIQVVIGRLALDPFSGLLARDVVLSERKDGGRVLATVSGIALSLNLSELMARRIVVDKLEFDDAAVSIPVESRKGSPHIDLEDVHAEVILLGDQLRLSQFNGTLEGIRVELTGQFLNPRSFQLKPGGESAPPRSTPSASPSPQTDPAAGKMLGRALETLAKVRFPSGPPLIQARVEADLADINTLRIEDLKVRAGRIESPWWKLQSVELNGSYSDGILKVPRLAVRDATGSLEVSAEWKRADRLLEVAALSTLQPAPLIRQLAGKSPALNDLRFRKPPQIETNAIVEFAEGKVNVRATGMFVAPAIEFKGVDFRDVSCGFAWKDGLFYARDLRVSVGKGLLQGNIWVGPGDYRIAVENTIAPTALLSLFDEKTRAFIANMEFKDLPDIAVALRASKLDFAGIRGAGRIKLGRTAIRGSWMESAASDFEIGDRCVTYKNFQVTGAGGQGTGTFAYDVGLQEARLDKVRSTMTPEKVLLWIDPKIAQAVVPYRFRTPPTSVVQGKVHLKDATKNNLSISLQTGTGLDYDLLGKTLHFGPTNAQINVVGTKVLADVKRGELMGGTVSMKAVVSIDARDPTFGADVKLGRVNFAKLTKLYFDYDTSKGVVSGNYKFDARVGKENLMRGSGSLRVEDGNVFAIPILGPFSDILGSILPGVAYQSARLATADFTVANEIINTKNLTIEGAGFSMFGSGDIHFMTSKLDMDMRLNAKGLPGIVFFPVSKLLEYVSTGTVSDPAWRPKIIPRINLPGKSSPKAKGR